MIVFFLHNSRISWEGLEIFLLGFNSIKFFCNAHMIPYTKLHHKKKENSLHVLCGVVVFKFLSFYLPFSDFYMVVSVIHVTFITLTGLNKKLLVYEKNLSSTYNVKVKCYFLHPSNHIGRHNKQETIRNKLLFLDIPPIIYYPLLIAFSQPLLLLNLTNLPFENDFLQKALYTCFDLTEDVLLKR